MFGANLVILTQICDELSRAQAKFPRILSQHCQNDLEDQGHWPSFSIPPESISRCVFGANLVIKAQICDKLLGGQAKFLRMLSQKWQNDLEGQSQWPSFFIPTESIPRCMFGANLVILAQICDELSRGQRKVHGQTDGRTDRQTDERRQRQLPFDLKGQGLKIVSTTGSFAYKGSFDKKNDLANVRYHTDWHRELHHFFRKSWVSCCYILKSKDSWTAWYNVMYTKHVSCIKKPICIAVSEIPAHFRRTLKHMMAIK